MVIFKYKSGANPYISKTEKETERMLKKYKNKIIAKQQGLFYKYYTIDDTNKGDNYNE